MADYDYLTHSLGSQALHKYQPPPRFKNPYLASDFIPVMVTGGVGDLILALDVIQQLEKIAPVKVWSSHPAASKYFRGAESTMLAAFPGFDFWIRLNSVAEILFSENFRKFPFEELDSIYMHQQSYARSPAWQNLIHHHPYLDHFLAKRAVEVGLSRRTLPLSILGLNQTELFHMERPSASAFDFSPYITVHDGFELNQKGSTMRSTKSWNLRHWATLIERIRKEYPGIMIAQLGSTTSRPIPGVDLNFVGRTDLAQAFDILKSSLLHIDGDSGLVHAARTFGTKCIVLFGSTPADFFGHPENVNIEPSIPCKGCWWTKQNWLQKCVIDKPGVACLDSIQPETVFEKVKEALNAVE